MNSVYKFFRSVRLAVVLILVIILFALLSTLIPQAKTLEEYRQMYSPLLLSLITLSGLQNYTSSLLFLVSTGLFIVNLGVCTIDRLVTRARNKAVRHFGPDLIHVGLLILALGALITASVRREQDFNMSIGDAVNLPGGYSMSLTDFQYLQYPDGRPRAWISTVDLKKGETIVKTGVKIEVNHPLAVGQLKVYQMNYGSDSVINLVDAAGQPVEMRQGQGLNSGDTILGFAGTRRAEDPAKGYLAKFEEWKGQAHVSDFEIGAGDKLGEYQVASISVKDITGLRAATDPGFIFVLIALIIASVGLTMTSIHKSKGDI